MCSLFMVKPTHQYKHEWQNHMASVYHSHQDAKQNLVPTTHLLQETIMKI